MARARTSIASSAGKLLAADEPLPGVAVGREAERRLGAALPLRVAAAKAGAEDVADGGVELGAALGEDVAQRGQDFGVAPGVGQHRLAALKPGVQVGQRDA